MLTCTGMPPVEVLELWATSPAGLAFAFAIGAVLGSFANVCIYRLPPSDEHPEGQSIVSPGSRCGSCNVGFTPRYLFVEVATGMLFSGVYALCVTTLYFEEPLAVRLGRFAIYAMFCLVLVVVAFIDLDTKLILNKVTYPSIVLFYGLGLTLPERLWYDGLIGAAVGYGGIRLIADGYYWLTKREGMGYGDGKLLALVGALFGWQGVLMSLFAGSLVGSVIMVTALLIQRRSNIRHVELPFGPFLVVGAIGYMFGETWVKVSFSVLWGG